MPEAASAAKCQPGARHEIQLKAVPKTQDYHRDGKQRDPGGANPENSFRSEHVRHSPEAPL